MFGDGDPSDSGWEFVSECGSVAGSDVSVLAAVGVSARDLCEDVALDSEWDFVESPVFFLSMKRNFVCVEGEEDMNYEGEAPLCPKRRMTTPLEKQSS